MILSNIDLTKFLKTDYIFEVTPSPQSDYIYLSIIYGLLILISIGLWFYYNKKQKNKKVWQKMRGRVFNLFFYSGLIGLFLVFFRFQQIAYLGSRFFTLILWLVIFIWAFFTVLYRFTSLKQEFKNIEKKENFEKYLPHRQAGLPNTKRK